MVQTTNYKNKYLKYKLKYLKMINQQKNQKGGMESTEGLSDNRKQEILDFFRPIVDDEKLNDIERLLNNDPTLRSLNLSGYNIGNDGARVLAEALDQNTTLLTLELDNNNIGDDSVEMIAMMIKNNTTIRRLDLARNNFSDGAANQINDALRHNTTIHYLIGFDFREWDMLDGPIDDSYDMYNREMPESARARAIRAAIQEIIPIVQHCQATGENFYKYLRMNNLRHLMRFGNMDEGSYDNLRASYPELPKVSPWKWFEVIKPTLGLLKQRFSNKSFEELPVEYQQGLVKLFGEHDDYFVSLLNQIWYDI